MKDELPIHVIINPVAGNRRAKKVGRKVLLSLSKLNIRHVAYYTENPGHAGVIAGVCAKERAKTVLSVGGDGTAYEVAQGLLGTETAMGIIPAGTGNDFIKSLNLPKDPIKCLKYILGCEPQSVDIGKINDEIFMNVCGIGFDVSVLDYSIKAKKYLKGMLPYLWGVIRTIINYEPSHVTVAVDDEKVVSEEILVCCVANGRFIGGGMLISPNSTIDDGILDVIVVKNVSRARMVKYLPGLLRGKILDFPETKEFRGKNIHFSSLSNKMRINIDGEIKNVSQAEFSVANGLVKIYF